MLVSRASLPSRYGTYAIRESLLLILGGLLDLGRMQVAFGETLMELLQADPADDVQRVDDVAQAFAHLSAVAVANQAVTEDFCERNRADELKTEHDHSARPLANLLHRRLHARTL